MRNQTAQTQGQTELFEAPYRATAMGGFTRPVALKAIGGKLRVVNPLRIMLSRSGRHGVWLYRRSDFDVLLYLETSNSGRPYITMEICDLPQEVCRRVYDAVYRAWVVDGASPQYVEKMLEEVEV